MTVNGVIKTEDVDYFVVEAKKGERISVEIEALRLGRTFFDPCIAILDEKRFELATADDTPLLRQDAAVSIIAPHDGRFIVRVRESAYGGSNACVYRLHVGKFPRPFAVFPAGGKPGEKVNVRWIGDPLGDKSHAIEVPKNTPANHMLAYNDTAGVAPSSNAFRVIPLDNALEIEPNNNLKEATLCKVPCAMNGIIEKPGDRDHFRFKAKKGEVFIFELYARRLRSPLDPVAHLRYSSGKYIIGSDDSAGQPDCFGRMTIPEDGEYDLEVHDHLKAGGPNYTYRLEITRPKPKVELQIQERRIEFTTKLELPQGNRVAFLVRAARADFGGPLNIALQNLPKGVTVETVTMPANRGVVPIILSAAADAPLAGALPNVVATPAEEGKTVTSKFKQRTWLVTGRNRREVWSHYAKRASLAVTQKVPFTLAIVQPKVPIVRSGTMQLKVVAKRDEGFVEPIRVRLLYNPPGISASRSISIPKGKSEALIPVTANGGAPPQTWDICVEGITNIAGQVIVSTPFAKLRVDTPYVQLNFPKEKVTRGESVDFRIGVKVLKPFEGKAEVVLRGLPAGTTVAPVSMTKETKELVFHIQTTVKAPPGRHKAVLCQFAISEQGEPIAHNVGTGELRIDKPVPPKVKPVVEKEVSVETESAKKTK